jgi:hypothetical protein
MWTDFRVTCPKRQLPDRMIPVALACAKRFSDKGFEADPEGVNRLLGSGAPDRAAERRHKRDGSRDDNCGGYDGEQCR